MYAHSSPSAIQALFVESLPHRPYAGTRKDRLRKVWAAEALGLPHIETDRPTLISWMKFDVDGKAAAARWIDAGMPQPHFIVRNRHKDGCHYYYGLKTPVVKGFNARALPRNLFAQVASAMTYAFHADFGYTGHSAKNPLSRTWHTDTYEGELYELNDLKDALPHELRHLPSTESVGVGRNCHLFSVVLAWAYAELDDMRGELTEDRWKEIVKQEAHHFNRYAPKLPRSEVDGLARRCAHYSWTGYVKRFRGDVATLKRSQRLSHLRDALTSEESRERMVEGGREGGLLGAPITNAIRRNKTFDAITGAIGLLASQGIHEPTVVQIAQASGLSRQTVYEFRRRQGQAHTAAN